MEDLTITRSRIDFGAAHEALRRYVDGDILPGVSAAVLRGRELVDLHCVGWADREARIALRPDHVFRVFSNTKLVTSCAALLLVEAGRLGLDDPVERYLPQLANRRVLRPGATSVDDTEPARGPITIRHLMSHSAGLSYGLFDPGTPMYRAYNERRVLNPAATLAQMVDALADLPLVYHPGTSWEYSVATDVLARVVEVAVGERFDRFVASRILEPLGMADTGFVVPERDRARLVAYYAGADFMQPSIPGLTRTDDSPWPGAFLRAVPWLSGGGGLVSTLPDMIALVRSLLPGGPTLLRTETISQMATNQLPDGVWLRFATFGEQPGKGYGLAGAVTVEPAPHDPVDARGELQWGGVAGTHWWINPASSVAGVVMTQRQMSFWNPFFFEFKRLVSEAVAAAG